MLHPRHLRVPGLVILLATLLTTVLSAQDAELEFAVAQLSANGPQPFARALFESNPGLSKRVSNELAALTKDAGPLLDSDIVSRTELTPRFTRLIVALNYQKHPVFLRLDYYRADDQARFVAALCAREWDDLFPLRESPAKEL